MNKNQDQNSQSIPSGHPSQTEPALPDTHTPQRPLMLPQPQTPEVFGPVVYAYTRAQALADGVQMDASTLAAEAGFKIPVYLTEAVFREFVQVPAGVSGQDETGRLWDILTMLRHAVRKSHPRETRLPFKLYVRNNDEGIARLVTLAAECGAKDFDDPAPALTIMLPNED